MARGVADVLALYLDPANSVPGTDALHPSSSAAENRARDMPIWAPCDPGTLVEPFVIWNLNRALQHLGRALRLHRAPRADAGSILVLVHTSEEGLRRAERTLRSCESGLPAEIVVYGEHGHRECATWTQRLAQRYPDRRASLVHRGGVETGAALARSILRREPIVDRPTTDGSRDPWLAVCKKLGQPLGPHPSDAPGRVPNR